MPFQCTQLLEIGQHLVRTWYSLQGFFMTLYYKRGKNADGWTDGFSALYSRLSQGACLGYL